MSGKASEVGACKELEGHIFTIGSGNKGKDGDMLRTSMEKMTTYIGTKFGDEAAQEWISGKKIVPTEPTYLLAIKARHAARVKATKDRIDLRLRGLTTEKAAIEAELLAGSSTDRTLLRELREVRMLHRWRQRDSATSAAAWRRRCSSGSVKGGGRSATA
jgi:hypothetical protein